MGVYELLDLTQRDFSSNDYEQLSLLDRGLKKKTLSCEVLETLPSERVSFENLGKVSRGDQCVMCLCNYEEGEDILWIEKCSHVFHKQCLETWLAKESTSCPICRTQI